MDHLLVHRLAVLRRAVVGEEDGTPVYSEEPVAVPWGGTGMEFGACRLDTPRDVSVERPDGTRITVQRSTVLTQMGFPGKELDTLQVTTDLGAQTWLCGGITDAGGMHGAHHIEISVSREIHRS